MFFTRFREVLFAIVVIRFFCVAYGISIYYKEKNLTEEEKRGATEIKKEVGLNNGETLPKAKTEKRGIWEIGSNNDHYEGLHGSSYYGEYVPNGYESDFSHTGIKNSGHLGYYESGGHQYSGGYGFSSEGNYPPSHYEPHYGSAYGGGYEEEHHHQEHGGGGGGYGLASLKALTLKKLLLPLAGLAILGVAAAASHNPILLQLGVVNGRKKRSALTSEVYPLNPKVRPQAR